MNKSTGFINLTKKPNSELSVYVIINSEMNIGSKSAAFNLAKQGGFLEHMGDTFYKCKRTVADNLSLVIMSDYPLTM